MIKSIDVRVPHSYEPGDQATLPVTVTLDIPIGETYTCIVGVEHLGQIKETVSHVANTVHGYLKYNIPNSAKGDVKISITAYIKKGSEILEKKTIFVTLPVNAKAQAPEKLYVQINLDGLNNPHNVTLKKNPTTLKVTVRPTYSGTMKVTVEPSSLGTVIANKNFYAESSFPKTIELSVEFPKTGKYYIKIKQKIVETGIAKYKTLVSWPVTVTVPNSPYTPPTPPIPPTPPTPPAPPAPPAPPDEPTKPEKPGPEHEKPAPEHETPEPKYEEPKPSDTFLFNLRSPGIALGIAIIGVLLGLAYLRLKR